MDKVGGLSKLNLFIYKAWSLPAVCEEGWESVAFSGPPKKAASLHLKQVF